MLMPPPIGRRSPHDAARLQRAGLPAEALMRRWATCLYFQAPLARGFFFERRLFAAYER
jgi:hypothetical protein